VIYPASTPVGNATLVVANVLTCKKTLTVNQQAQQGLIMAARGPCGASDIKCWASTACAAATVTMVSPC
jgi:hypothetical protein